MTRFADPTRCPDCRAELPADPEACPACDLPLRGTVAVSLFRTLTHADLLLAQLRAAAVVVPAGSGVLVPDATDAAAATTRTATRTATVTTTGTTTGTATATTTGTTTGTPRRAGLRGASVPTILLGLGALCLLVAAVIFLAVAWSWLGIGGRTAVLVALTLTTGALGSWLAGRGLRVAAEAITLVGLGLLTLDVVGADNAGWLGDLSLAGLVAVVGAALLLAGLALLRAPGHLVVPQLAAVVGLGALAAGVAGVTTRGQVVATAAVLAFAALVLLGRRLDAPVLSAGALVGAALSWQQLVALALASALAHPTARGLWLEGHGVGLLTASALLLLPVVLPRSHPLLRRGAAGAAACLTTATIALPTVDDGPGPVTAAALVLLVLWAAAALAAPRSWHRVVLAPLVLAVLPVAVVTARLLADATVSAFSVGATFGASAGTRLPDLPAYASPALLVPGVVGLLLAAAVAVPGRVRGALPTAAAATALAVVATLALRPVPLWTVVVLLTGVGVALLVATRWQDRRQAVWQSGLGVLVLLAAILVALPSAGLGAVSSGALLLCASALLAVGATGGVRAGAWVVLAPAASWLLWCLAELAAVDVAVRAVPVLLVAGVVMMLRPQEEVEVVAGATALLAAAAAVPAASDPGVSLALHLTLAGALVTTAALLRPERRALGWVGGGLLAAATWVRLADVGVTTPEAYTLPTAVALVLVGLRRLHRDPRADSWTALAPGLLLGTVPSLLGVLAGDASSWRAVLLGLGCLLLVLAGTRLRWNAPLVLGSGVGTVLVLRELAPYAGQTPQWVLIGLAGLLLTVVGVTWESRMRQARHAAAYLARLR